MLINWLIMGYFLILFGERIQSLIRSFADKNLSMWGDGFSRYVNGICILSLAASVILLFTINRDFLKALLSDGTQVNAKMICITIGVILISGMVHTEYTIPGIQFASYGFLIAALVIRTAKNNAMANDSILLWLSLVAAFAYMAYRVFNNDAVNLFMLLPIIIAVIGDAVILSLRWKEQVNTFVLIFIIASAVMWLAGFIASRR